MTLKGGEKSGLESGHRDNNLGRHTGTRTYARNCVSQTVAYPGIFSGEGGLQIQLRTEGR
jgi:hypothetical protein